MLIRRLLIHVDNSLIKLALERDLQSKQPLGHAYDVFSTSAMIHVSVGYGYLREVSICNFIQAYVTDDTKVAVNMASAAIDHATLSSTCVAY